ncbi:ATP synthase F0F1 subunit delta [Intrasporangium oryzae NRRL B-24470]|uniref:ATP synthase subunit delta n=1 Tax=Intrasporangium oryzae NRRL B-24470 TaxID=1386089 RepID=W9GEJ6_9MICO|nr:F0F1 ATP synthase subunit delta [Intrasporangium oryzae]EWT02299.1 ATP synthase F0F1 subunit delta [Intrasporangium oryzae NRRL B-24470]
MQGSSRAAAAASRDAFTGALAAGADRSRLAGELLAVVAVLDGNATLRRAVADASREGADKAALAERLFGGKVSAEALAVLKGVFGQRWSSERDLSDTIESYAVESVIASAEEGDRADTVEDQLFRFERIVAADAGLRAALTDESVPADKRSALVDSLLTGKVADETLLLVRQAVTAPRGRRFDHTIGHFLDIASTRRDQQTATVTSAVPLSDEERDRLAAGLSSIYGGKVHVNTVVDPRVLGGVKVEIGDELIDGTVIRKLDGARRAMGA